MMARVIPLVSSFRVCVVVIALFVLLALAVLLPTRVAEAMLLLFFLVVMSVRVFILAAVLGHAFLSTSERLAVVTERSEVGVQKAAKVLEGVPTLFEGVCILLTVKTVASVFGESGDSSGR